MPVSVPSQRIRMIPDAELQPVLRNSKRAAVADSVVLAAMNGDPDAFAEIYLQYRGLVFSVCRRLVDNPAIREELVQDTFVLVLRKIHLFKGRSELGTWIYQIARRTALMYIRDHQRKDMNASVSDWQDEEMKDSEPGRKLQVEDGSLRSAADRITLGSLIVQLAPGYRSTLLLHDCFGYEHTEICKIMNVREGTSKSQLHKARLRLRQMLDAR